MENWDHLHFDNNEFLGFISGHEVPIVVGTSFASIRVINMDARMQHGREVLLGYFWQFEIQVQCRVQYTHNWIAKLSTYYLLAKDFVFNLKVHLHSGEYGRKLHPQ